MAFLYVIDKHKNMAGRVTLFRKNLCKQETMKSAIGVAFAVAPLLILINQHEAILNLRFTSNFFFKAILTFFVPFAVSAYSSARAFALQEKIQTHTNDQS
jgi:hypothetical protein